MTPKTVTCRDKDNNKTEVLAEKLEFRPSAYGVVIKDEHILLVRQWDGYDFPGGGVDLGESLPEAVQREVKEETGFSVTVKELLYVTEDYFKSFLDPDRYFHSLLFYYGCTDPVGSLSADGFVGREKDFMQLAEWVPLERIDSVTFCNAIDSPALIRAAIEGKNLI